MLPTAPVNKYPFTFLGGINHTYAFTTDDDVGYEIRFIPSAYMFEDYLDPYIDGYEMVILVVDTPWSNRLPADRRTAPTI